MNTRSAATVLACLLVFAASCQPQEAAPPPEETEAPAAQPEPSTAQAEGLLAGFQELWASGDVSLVDSIFAEDGVYEDVASQDVSTGREEIRALIEEFFNWTPDTKIEWGESLVTPDRAAVEWVWSGTQTGAIPNLMPATGRSFSVRGVSILHFRDGMISLSRDYYDSGGLLDQLGVEFQFPSEPEGQ
jgi:steroid delta-isomerase-like uncharacterized protein